MHLQPGEELLSILVLTHIDGLTIIILEGMPDACWLVRLLAAQCQMRKG